MEKCYDEYWTTEGAEIKTPWTPTNESNHYIIGYMAYDESKPEAALYHDKEIAALIVCSTPDILRGFVEQHWIEDAKGYAFKRIHFGQIMYGLINGIGHAFDKGSYSKFVPLLKKVIGKGYDRVRDPDFYDEETLIVFKLNPDVDYMEFKKK